jgi:hypothetical protein
MKSLWFATVIVVLVASATASTDPFVGKWVLIPTQSKYPTGLHPKSMIIEIEPAGRGIHYRSQATFSNGSTARSEYTADYNGKQVLVMGNRGMLLPVFLKRPDSRTVVASYTKGLQVVATSRRVVSRNGQSMTVKTVAKDQSGNSVTTIGVYEKQR